MTDQPRFPLSMANSPVLQALVRELGHVLHGERKPQAEPVSAALRQAATAGAWLPRERRRANHERYARHLIYADPRGQFSVLAIVWAPGQASPVHNHRTWHSIAIHQGVLTEKFYNMPHGKDGPVLTREEVRHQGYTGYDGAGRDLHQLVNQGPRDAISLHVYGVSGSQVSTGINRIYANSQT